MKSAGNPTMGPPTRRTALTGALALGAAILTAPANATTRLGYPMTLLYGRIGPEGLEHIDTTEQGLWTTMSIRLGGLAPRIEPIQRFSMLTNNPPAIDGGASNVLIARQIARDIGAGHVLLYSSHDGVQSFSSYNNWLSHAYARVRKTVAPRSEAIAEAHILDVDGGPPIISLSVDAPPRKWLNPLDYRRNPEQQVMHRLANSVEQAIQTNARSAYAAQASIAD